MKKQLLLLSALLLSSLVFVLPCTAQVPVPTPPAGITYAYPNPFDLSKYNQITIVFPIDNAVTITVVSLAGRTVAVVPAADINASQGYAVWNGKDGNGAFVASGLYFYIVRGTAIKMIGKITVLN